MLLQVYLIAIYLQRNTNMKQRVKCKKALFTRLNNKYQNYL